MKGIIDLQEVTHQLLVEKLAVKNQKNYLKIFRKRYKNIPPEYLAFLKQFEQITNQEDTVWFNSIEDFNKESETDFKWNEFEMKCM